MKTKTFLGIKKYFYFRICPLQKIVQVTLMPANIHTSGRLLGFRVTVNVSRKCTTQLMRTIFKTTDK